MTRDRIRIRAIPIGTLVQELDERLGHRGWGQCAVAEKCFVRSRELIADYDILIKRLLKRGYSPETAAELIKVGKQIAHNAAEVRRNLALIDFLSLDRKGANTRNP